MTSQLLVLSAFVLVDVLGPTPAPEWNKVYEATDSHEWISAVWAADPDNWFVAGSWGVIRVTDAGKQRHDTPGRAVEGLFGETSTSVFALGTSELVLHFDGKAWIQEHAAPVPKRPSRRDNLLYSATYLPDHDRVSLIAFGPDFVLRRLENGTWARPEGAERDGLSVLAETGPSGRPQNCSPEAWFWLGRDLAWFSCKDRRSFVYEAGHFAPHGKIPVSCHFVSRVAYARGAVYTVCADHELWKTEGQTWRALALPPGKDRDYFAVSVADKCVFLTGRHTVWRRCEP